MPAPERSEAAGEVSPAEPIPRVQPARALEPGPEPLVSVRHASAWAGLHRKLVWLTFFRLVTITVLLGGTAAVTWSGAAELAQVTAPLYALVLFTYLASLGFALALWLDRGLTLLAYAQVALDAVIAASVVAMTGYGESVFVFMFSLGIVNGSILLFRRGAIAATLLSGVAYLWVMLPAHPGARPPGALVVFAHLSALVLTAALASYLAEQLRRTGERLEQREGDLAAITALHEAIVQSVSSGIVTLDASGRITFLNRSGESITGLRSADIAGDPLGCHFRAFESGGARDEAEWVNARGESLRLGFTFFPLVGPARERIGAAVIFQDLTHVREMEAAVQRTERLADVGRLAAGLAHELRNPLASMSGCIELLRASDGLREQDQRLMGIVLREATRLEQLVGRFLAYSRPAPLVRARVDLAVVLDEIAEVFARDPAAARLRVERALAPAPVECDADQVRQVVWNLLANAAQAIEGGGRGGTIRLACGQGPDGGAWLEVHDDGPGVEPANVASLFTPFFTTKAQGTGLGLATIERIVDAHGGTVTVASEPGRGARFTVRLPPAPAGALPG